MKRVIITVSSQDNSLATMKELKHSELQITKEEQRRAISPTTIENQSAKLQTSAEEVVTTENTYNQWKIHDINTDNDKELEAKKLEVEELKTKLEDELFERLRIEDEFSNDREALEREILSLRERIDELQGEATWKIEDLENDFKILTTKYENAKDEITHLKVMLERTINENTKLRNDQSATDDRIMEILDEMESWKRKAHENAEKCDVSRDLLQDEIDTYEKEISGLKEKLNETNRIKDELQRNSELRLQCDCQKDESKRDIVKEEISQEEDTLTTNEKQLLELSTELNDLYRDQVGYQDRVLSLQEGLVCKEKELDDVRNDYESQNIEIQNYKEKYAELKDVALATSQENSHLKNQLEKKMLEYTELKKSNLVLETEVTWLREALGLIKTP